MTRVPPLLIVPLGEPPPDDALLRRLADALALRFATRADIDPPAPLREEWWDAARGQLSSNRVVDALIERYPHHPDTPPRRWVLAVTGADLFAPGRGFVFGEAARGGYWALVGLGRLGPLPDERLLKVAVHELGHLAGLDHCSRPDCAMYPATSVEDADRRGLGFCDACRASWGDGA